MIIYVWQDIPARRKGKKGTLNIAVAAPDIDSAYQVLYRWSPTEYQYARDHDVLILRELTGLLRDARVVAESFEPEPEDTGEEADPG